MTLPETLLWERVRRKALGVPFRRQHPIGPYVADFCCVSQRLIVEIDGQFHDRGGRPSRDAIRDAFLRQNGYHVLHVAASDVLRDPDDVAASIGALVAPPLHHRPAAGGPPPRAGEER